MRLWWRRSCVFIVYLERISYLLLVFLVLTLNKKMFVGRVAPRKWTFALQIWHFVFCFHVAFFCIALFLFALVSFYACFRLHSFMLHFFQYALLHIATFRVAFSQTSKKSRYELNNKDVIRAETEACSKRN